MLLLLAKGLLVSSQWLRKEAARQGYAWRQRRRAQQLCSLRAACLPPGGVVGGEALRLAPHGAGVLVETLRELATRGKRTSTSGTGSGEGAGARVAVRSVLEDHETAILELERQVCEVECLVNHVKTLEQLVMQLQHTTSQTRDMSRTVAELGMKLETRVERQVSVVDMLETRVQETQKVVADLDNNFTELEDDLELRVDEIAKSVLDSSKELQVLARSVKNLEQWVMRSRIVTYDLLMIVSRTWSNAGLEGCTASPGRNTSTGCSGWSRLCDHAAAVPAVRRVLRAFGSVPRQNGGHSSCMQILARTVHTVQQTVEISQVQFWGWFWLRPLLCNNRCLGWDRAMLRSMVDHMLCIIQGGFWKNFTIFYMKAVPC